MKIRNIIICEDIRQEVGNKISLMGILGSFINMDIQPNFPENANVMMSLACLVCIENTNPANDTKDFNVQVTMSIEESEFAKLNARIHSTGEDNRNIYLPVPKFEFGVKESTKFSINAKIMKNNDIVSEDNAVLDIKLNKR